MLDSTTKYDLALRDVVAYCTNINWFSDILLRFSVLEIEKS
jgi:hypothetical protein